MYNCICELGNANYIKSEIYEHILTQVNWYTLGGETMKKVLAIATLCLTVMTMFTACGKTTETQKEETRVVTDVKGEVTIPANPKRIVDLSGSSDILSVLGFEVVGTANADAYDYTKFPSYLEETLKDATILGYSMQDTMDIEAIIACEPDLIIISTYQEKMYDSLSEIAPTVMIQLAQMDWREDVLSVAKVMDREEEANTWLTQYDEKANDVSTAIKETYGEDTSYLAFLASGGQFFIFDGAAFGNMFYQELGLAKPEGMPEQENISLPTVTYEGLAAINADIIFCIATDADKSELEANSVWNGLAQVKDGNVIYLPSSPYFNQGYSCIGRMAFLNEVMDLLGGTK